MSDRRIKEIGVIVRMVHAIWGFWGVTESQFRRMWGDVPLEAGPMQKYCDFAQERILQRYLLACDFDVLFFLRTEISEAGRSFVLRPDPPIPERIKKAYEFRWIDACDWKNERDINHHMKLTGPNAQMCDPAMAVVSAKDLHYRVDQYFKGTERKADDTISVKEAGERLWGYLGVDMQAKIHAWMRPLKYKGEQIGPIFRPAHPVARRDPKGAQLDFTDAVTVGLIHCLLQYGARYADFFGSGEVHLMIA
jgi:hypothetical protein